VTDLDHTIFDNPNLGVNNHLPLLGELEDQAFENMQANAEGREPEKLKFDRFNVYGNGMISEVGYEEIDPRQGADVE
jgi:hypothetical protein